MTQKEYKEFQQKQAELEIEKWRKLLNWLDEKRKPAQKAEQESQVKEYNDNYKNNITNNNNTEIAEIKEIIFKENMDWINVNKNTSGNSYLGKCLSFSPHSLEYNRKALVALNLITPLDKPSNEQIDFILRNNEKNLIGKKIEYTVNNGGTNINQIIGIVNDNQQQEQGFEW